MNRKQFYNAGGFDERFKGWGFEDLAFRDAMNTLCGPFKSMDGFAIFHLWHPKKASIQNPNLQMNAKLHERYLLAEGNRIRMRCLVDEHLEQRAIDRCMHAPEFLTIDPYVLLNRFRFDFPAKYIYARFREMGVNSEWGKQLYGEHVRIMNGYQETHYTNKQGLDEFITSFDAILDSIKQIGFDAQKSILPVGENDILLDGAHRVSACLFYNKPVKIVRVKKKFNFDYQYFRNKGLSQRWSDAMALEYCRLKKETFIAIVFPTISNHKKKVRDILNKYGNVYYEKKIYLNEQGSINFINQLYLGEEWLGSWNNKFAGAQIKASLCFRRENPVRVYVFEAGSQREARLAKEEIRRLFHYGNHSIHINDTHDETIRVAEMVLNENSLHHINYMPINQVTQQFHKQFEVFKQFVEDHHLEKEHLCMVSGSVMGAYGIRVPADVDYLQFGGSFISMKTKRCNNHESELRYYEQKKDDIIFNPENHFYFEGYKFATLDVIYEMKMRRSEQKDDVERSLIKGFLGGKP